MPFAKPLGQMDDEGRKEGRDSTFSGKTAGFYILHF